jgi:two-component system, OmpR family, sensor histidine kinase VicK
MLPRFGIRNKLFLSILLILLLSYSTLIYSTVKNLYSTLEEDIGKELSTNLKFFQSQYLARADLIKYSLMQPATSEYVQKRLQAKDKIWLKDALLLWKNNLPFIDIMTVVDARKRVVARLFSNQAGDSYELNGIVDLAFRKKQPVMSTELVPYSFLCNEGKARFCVPPVNREAMLVVVIVPMISPNGEMLGALVAADILNNDPHLPYKVQEIFGKEVEVAISQRGLRIASSLVDDDLIPVDNRSGDPHQAGKGPDLPGHRGYRG